MYSPLKMTTTQSWNNGNWLPSDMMLYPRKTETWNCTNIRKGKGTRMFIRKIIIVYCSMPLHPLHWKFIVANKKLKTGVFCNVIPCSLVANYQCTYSQHCKINHTQIKKRFKVKERSKDAGSRFFQNVWNLISHHTPSDSNLCSHCQDNLKSSKTSLCQK